MREILHYFKLTEKCTGHAFFSFFLFDGRNVQNDFWGGRRISISFSLTTESVGSTWYLVLSDTLQAIWIEATEDIALSKHKQNTAVLWILKGNFTKLVWSYGWFTVFIYLPNITSINQDIKKNTWRRSICYNWTTCDRIIFFIPTVCWKNDMKANLSLNKQAKNHITEQQST